MNRRIIYTSIVIIVIVIIIGIVFAVPAVSINPDTMESETVCVLANTTFIMTYHVGTMPLCPATSSETQSTLITSSNSTIVTIVTSGPKVHSSCSPNPCPPLPKGITTTTINSSLFIVINGTTTESVSCTIPVQGELLLTVLNSSMDKPISGINVSVTEISPRCANAYSTKELGEMPTNGSGVVDVCCDVGSYNFTIFSSGT